MDASGRIVSAWYEYGKRLNLHFVLRTEDGKKKVVIPSPVKPYFFAKKSDLDLVTSEVKKLTSDYSILCGGWKAVSTKDEVVKVEVPDPNFVGKLRNALWKKGVELLEADIKFIRRVLIDLGIKDSVEIRNGSLAKYDGAVPSFRILFIDIECDDEQALIKTKAGESKIIGIGTVNEACEVNFFSSSDEKKLLSDFLSYAKHYDILVGYGSEEFDIPIIKERCRRLNIGFSWKEVKHLDFLELYKGALQRELPSWTLEYVAEKELGEKKLHPKDFGYGKYSEVFTKDVKLLERICTQHAMLVRKLEEKLGLVQLKIYIASIAGVMVDETVHVTVPIDTIILREAFAEKPRMVFPSRPEHVEGEKYSGSLVFEPKPGLHKNVLCLDYVSFYNRLIQTIGLSPEVYRDYHQEFDLDKFVKFSISRKEFVEPLVPRILDELEKERERCKKLMMRQPRDSDEYKKYSIMQKAVKTLLLSVYGKFGEKNSRFYNRHLAEVITAFAREILDRSKSYIEGKGFEVIYGDTDSIFIKLPKVAQKEGAVKVANEIANALNAQCEVLFKSFGATYVKVEVAPKCLYEKVFFGKAKKKRVGLVAWEEGRFLEKPELEIVGYEYLRSDWCDLARELQLEVFKMIFDEKDKKSIISYVQKVRSDLMSFRIPASKLVLSGGVRKKLDEYKCDSLHVKVAKKMKSKGLPVPDKVQYVITSVVRNAPIPEPVVDEVPEVKDLKALQYLWEKRILPPTLRVLSCIFPDAETCLSAQMKLT